LVRGEAVRLAGRHKQFGTPTIFAEHARAFAMERYVGSKQKLRMR
jgi:hypothetical protein